MKKTAKIRILAWLMVICLLVPELSLNAFAADVDTTIDELAGYSTEAVSVLTETDSLTIDSATVKYTATSSANFEGVVGFYIKKDAKDTTWEKKDSFPIYGQDASKWLDGTYKSCYTADGTYNFSGLDADTAYKYAVVFADVDGDLPAVDKVDTAKECSISTFKTLAKELVPAVTEEDIETGRYKLIKLPIEVSGTSMTNGQNYHANLYIEDTVKVEEKDVQKYVYKDSENNRYNKDDDSTKYVTFTDISTLPSGKGLNAGTTYKYMVVVSENAISNTIDPATFKGSNVFTGTFTTKADNRAAVEMDREVTTTSVTLRYAVTGLDEELDDSSPTRVTVKYREKTEANKNIWDGVWNTQESLYRYDNQTNYAEITLYGLDASKKYEYVVGVWDGDAPKNVYTETKEDKTTALHDEMDWHFVTAPVVQDLADVPAKFDASVAILSADSKLISHTLVETEVTFDVEGTTPKNDENAEISYMYKLATEKWEDATVVGPNRYSVWSAGEKTLRGLYLKPATTYVIHMAVSDNAITSKEALAKVGVEYTFTTPSDDRNFTSLFVDTGYNSVTFRAYVNIPIGLETHATAYVKDGDTWKIKSDWWYDAREECYLSIDSLKNATSYDYVIALSDGNIEGINPDDATFADNAFAIKKGTFTTDNAAYSISFNGIKNALLDEKNNYTPATAEVTLTAKSELELDNVVFAKFNYSAVQKDDETKAIKDDGSIIIPLVKDANGTTYTSTYSHEVYSTDWIYTINSVDLFINEAGTRHFVKTLTGPYGSYTYEYKGTPGETVPSKEVKFFTREINAKGEVVETPIEEYKLNAGSYGQGIQYAEFSRWADDIIVRCMNGDKIASYSAEITKIEGDTDAVSGLVSGNASGTVYGLKPGTVKVTFTASDTIGKNEDGTDKTPISATITIKVGDFRPVYLDGDKEVSADPGKNTDGGYAAVSIATGKSKTFAIKDYSLSPVKTASQNATYTIKKTAVATNKDGGAEITGKGLGITDVIANVDGYKVLMIVSVKAAPQGFNLYSIDKTADGKDAIDAGDVFKLAYDLSISKIYTIRLKETPDNSFNFANNSDYKFTSSDENIATVDDAGQITLKKADALTDVTITVESKEGLGTVEFKIRSLSLPKITGTTVAWTNFKMNTLEKVPMPDTCTAGVQWVEPKTKIDGLKADNDGELFAAQYVGELYYPLTGKVTVIYDTIYAPYVYDNGDNHVIQIMGVGGFDDVLGLNYGATTRYGSVPTLRVAVDPVKNLIIKDNDLDDTVNVYATKAGNYTIKATVYVEVGGILKQLGKVNYKFAAVDKVLVGDINLQAFDANNIMIADNWGHIGSLCVDNAKAADVSFVATAYNRNGVVMDAKDVQLIWSTDDVSVAQFADKSPKDSTKNILKYKGVGNTYVNVTSADKAAESTSMVVQFRDVAPIIENTTVTVNTALDYASPIGRMIAEKEKNYVVIAPKHAYGDDITSVVIYEGAEPSKNFKAVAYNYDSKYFVVPTASAEKDKTYDLTLKVNTKLNAAVDEKLTVKTVYNVPALKAKNTKKVNLFYTKDTAEITVTGPKNVSLYVTDAIWDKAVSDNAVSANRLTATSTYEGKKGQVVVLSQTDIDLKKSGKKYIPNETDVFNRTLDLKLEGYKDYIPVNSGNKVKVGYTYKNGSVKVTNKPSVCTAIGNYNTYASLYDSYLKSWLYYASTDTTTGYIAYNDYFEWTDGGNNSNLSLNSYSNRWGLYIGYSYASKKSSEKTTVKLYSNNWAAEKTVKITVKNVKPTPVLTRAKLVYNTTLGGDVITQIDIKNGPGRINLSDLEVKGANSKAQALLDNGALEIGMYSRGIANTIYVYKNYNLVSENGLNIKDGNYSFKLTATTSNGTKLKPVTLKVAITSKAPTVSVKVVGKLDNYREADYYIDNTDYDLTGAYITEPKFKNVPTDWEDNLSWNRTLVGDYSQYFNVAKDSRDQKYHIAFNKAYNIDNEIAANYSYKVAVKFTSSTNAHDSVSVTSKPVTIKTVQKNVKVKVLNAVTMYKNSDDWYYAYIETAKGYTGSAGDYYYPFDIYYDVNSDGTGYIAFNIDDENYNFSKKNYTVPVTLLLKGRDDVAKDVTAKVKVTVK